jgi:dethiobiotin synthetase
MTVQQPVGLFITGTDTEVGKTVITAQIASALHAAGKKVGVYKPVASGCSRQGDRLVADDALAIWEAAGQPGSLHDVCPQCFEAPLAPPLAAEKQGEKVDPVLLRHGIRSWQQSSDVVLVEGSGGLLSPVSEEDFVADLALEFGYPLLIVVPNQLGAVNQALQTLVTATTFREGLSVAGLILNQRIPGGQDLSTSSNSRLLQQHAIPPLLAELPFQGTLPSSIDWMALARQPMENAPAGDVLQ